MSDQKETTNSKHHKISSAIDVNHRQLIEILKIAFTNFKKVMIIGEPGQGKTQCVAQAVKEIGYDLILSHPAVEDSTSIAGMPDLAGDRAVFKPFGQLYKVLNATRPTVWDLEDFGQGSTLVQSGYMQFLLGGQLNEYKIPDCVVMCATTNERTHKAGVMGILEPVKDRFDIIVRLVSQFEESKKFMYENNWPTELIGFLEMRPDLLSDFTPTNDLTKCPTPRSWDSCAQWVRMALNGEIPKDLQLPIYAGCIGEGAGIELTTVLDEMIDMPDLKKIIADPENAPIPVEASVMYAVCIGLAYMATNENFTNIWTYSQRLQKENKTEFAALLLRDSVHRAPEVVSTQSFKELAASPIGQSLIGRERAA